MDGMTFDLLSPERRIATFDTSAIDLPGLEGDMSVMPGHAGIMTALRPGVIRARSEGRQVAYAITGGFVEVTAQSTVVLAKLAVDLETAHRTDIEAHVGAAQTEAETAQGPQKDFSDKRLFEMRALYESLPA